MNHSSIGDFNNEEVLQLTGWLIEPARYSAQVLEKCTLIIPTFRRPQSLITLLEQLTNMSNVPVEVIVVDGTPDKEVENQLLLWVEGKELLFQIKYVRSPAGLTLQRNIGIEASRREIIFFLDDDCVPQEGYFKTIFQVFEKDASKTIGGVAGSIINEIDRPLSFRWRLRIWINLVPKNGVPGKYYPNATSVPRGLMKPFSGEIPTDIIPGGASAYRKEVFITQHFSEFFSGYAQGEDLEMSLRIGHDWQLLWCGDAHVLHLHTPTGRPHPFAKGKMEIVNRYFIWKRYKSNLPVFVRIKFWADVILIGMLDLCRFIIRPWQIQPFLHFWGVVFGAFHCIFFPPKYLEPSDKRTYSFQYETFSVASWERS